MLRFRWLEVFVGAFMLAGLLGFFMLALKVSGYTDFADLKAYMVTADFDNIGDLKVRAPVSIAGVRVGEVSNVTLNPETFMATVAIKINKRFGKIPFDSSAQILTQGLLGSNYIGLTPGFEEDEFLHEGSVIEETHPALILENLIGQLVFSLGDNDKDETSGAAKE